MPDPVRFTLNDRPVTLDTDPSRTLLWVLRTDLELTGTKYGCGVGQCGSCTVVLDGRAVRACQTRLRDVAGKRVTTIEGLARDGTLHPLQEAFAEHGGFQCGYCTPGMIMSAYAMVQATPAPSTARIVEGLEGNLCRCGAHQRIVEAIATVTHGGVGGDHD